MTVIIANTSPKSATATATDSSATPAQNSEAVVSTPVVPAVTTAPGTGKVSWLAKVGHFIGKILGFVATESKPIADTATAVISTLYPSLAVAAQAGDALVSKIALQAAAVESVAAQAGTASGTGPQKFEQVLQAMGPAIDQWVANAFPGAGAVSAAKKAGLVEAVVQIVNDVTPSAATPSA